MTAQWFYVFTDERGRIVDEEDPRFDCGGGPFTCGGCGQCLAMQAPPGSVHHMTRAEIDAVIAARKEMPR